MTIRVTGLDKLMRAYRGVEDVVDREASAIILNNVNDMADYAQSNHRYQSQGGPGESAVQGRLLKPQKGKFARGKVAIYKRQTSVKWRGKRVSYMVFQHEGTYSNYKKSPIAPALPHSSSPGGIRADHFLWRAINRYKKRLARELNEIPGEVKKYFRRGGR